MTTEKKVASKAVPPTATSTTAASKSTRQSTARRTAIKKAPVKRASSKATTTVNKSATAATEADHKVKSGKVKMERDSFTMPKDEYAQLAELKARLLALGKPAKKSELLRAGIKLLAAMTDLRLKKAMLAVPVIKTGRPKKKK